MMFTYHGVVMLIKFPLKYSFTTDSSVPLNNVYIMQLYQFMLIIQLHPIYQ